jgi:hypothetical protein
MFRAFWILVGLMAFETGCSGACGGERDDEIVIQEGGKAEDGIYVSASWNQNWDDFPGGRTIIFKHRLGVVPEFVQTFVSFKKDGVASDASASENAGNQGLIQCMDQTAIRVVNDTCSELFIRVVAIASTSGDVPLADPAATLDDCSHIEPH